MEADRILKACLLLTRFVQFSACLLIFGVCVFDRLIVAPLAARNHPLAAHWARIARLLMCIAFSAALLSGMAWFASITVEMSGQPPAQALRAQTLQLVWAQTQFGRLWQWRAICWLAATITAAPAILIRKRRADDKGTSRFELRASSFLLSGVSAWLALFFSALLLASLAWAGHGRSGTPVAWHLTADVLHLLIAGIWPAGLLPFAWLMAKVRRSNAPDKWLCLVALTRRFSTMALLSVTLLALTGFADSWFLVGSLANLIGTTYGRVLMVKIGLFGLMLTFGAFNRLYLKPRLGMGAPGSNEIAAARLQRSVLAELALAGLVIIGVAVLGVLPPATLGNCPM